MLNKIQEISMKAMLVYMLLIQTAIADSLISIDQSGDNLTLVVDQIGYNSIIEMYNGSYIDSNGNAWNFDGTISGEYNTIGVKQNSQSGGEQVVSIGKIVGTSNELKIGQGYEIDVSGTFVETADYGGDNFIGVAITGDYNYLEVSQTDSLGEGHHVAAVIESDNNTIKIKQKDSASHFLELGIFNDFNDVDITQESTGNHTIQAEIDGLYETDLSIIQNGTIGQTFTIQQYCMTASGCTVTVTQN
jgi:hypothetical protein